MKKQLRYRLRWKYPGDRAWMPSGWATNSTKEAIAQAERYKDDEKAQVWDYKTKTALSASPKKEQP